MSSEFFVRNRLDEFRKYRCNNKCIKKNLSNEENSYSEQNNCNSHASLIIDDVKRTAYDKSFRFPWERAFFAFITVANAVEIKLNSLHNLELESLKLRFTSEKGKEAISSPLNEFFIDDSRKERKEIREEKCKSEDECTVSINNQRREITKLIKELERIIVCGIDLSSASNGSCTWLNKHNYVMTTKTTEEITIAYNVQCSLKLRLKEIINKFKEMEGIYYKRCRRREQQENQFRNFGTDEVYNLLSQESKVVELLQLGYAEEELESILLERSRQEELSKEVNELLQNISDINNIFSDINSLVNNQGTMLDRVDYNLHLSAMHTKRAQQELNKALEHQSKCTTM